MNTRRFLKFLHTLGAIGVTGGLAAYMFVIGTAPEPATASDFAAHRHTAAEISKWLIVPGIALALFTGVLSMAVHFPFQNAGWVWAKALSGFLILESTFATVDGPARRAATAGQELLAGNIDLARAMAQTEDRWGAWYVLLVLFGLNVVLAIWRPRFSRRQRGS